MISQFLRLILTGAADLRRRPLAQLFTLTAVAMVTLLAGMFMTALYNVDRELLKTEGMLQIQIYWKPTADMDQVRAQWDQLKQRDGVSDLVTYTPDQALDDLSDSLGNRADFAWVKNRNPLPPTAQASFAMPTDADAQVWTKSLLSNILAMPGVDKVHFNPLQHDLAQNWITTGRRIIWPVIGFLGLVVALVVGNTMKLALLTRQDEVEILSLVGARQWYIRLPLLAGGGTLGLIGSLIGLGLLKVVQSGVADVLNFAPLYIRIDYLPFEQGALLALVVTGVCTLSSWVAVRA